MQPVINVLIWCCVVTTTAFPLLYGLRSVWYQAWTGWVTLAQSLALAATYWLTALAITAPDWSARPALRVATYAFVFLATAALCGVLLRHQQRDEATLRPRRYRRAWGRLFALLHRQPTEP